MAFLYCLSISFGAQMFARTKNGNFPCLFVLPAPLHELITLIVVKVVSCPGSSAVVGNQAPRCIDAIATEHAAHVIFIGEFWFTGNHDGQLTNAVSSDCITINKTKLDRS